MDDLIEELKKVLADTFALYLKTHNFHWNVEGTMFLELHQYFGELYEELHDSVDPIAEEIRTLNSYAPGSFTRFLELTSIEDSVAIPTTIDMIDSLIKDNQTVINTLTSAYNLSEKEKELGLANFLQDRIDVHKKHAWKLRSIRK
jgi:starvation-inducible DNA-binding protein